MEKKIVIIGDVHGCLDELKALLEKIGYTPESHRVIIAGDLVDRGPDSCGVVSFVRTNGFECVMGNHEEKHVKMFGHLEKRRANPNYKIPMRPFGTDKMAVFNSLSEEDFKWIRKLPAYIELPHNWIVVHAGFEPNKKLSEQEFSRMNHIRYLSKDTLKTMHLQGDFSQPANSIYWTEVYNLPYNVVYGHNVHSLSQPNIVVTETGKKLYGIDTGACFGGMLTALILPDEQIVQVPASKAYARSYLHKEDKE